MKANPAKNLQRQVAWRFLLLALALSSAGCQTFSLTQEQLEKQQRGEQVDREVGDAVGVLGTLGYYGAVTGQIIARILK